MKTHKEPSKHDWEARSDADALIRSQQVTADPKRLKRAKSAAREIAREADERAARARLESDVAKKLKAL